MSTRGPVRVVPYRQHPGAKPSYLVVHPDHDHQLAVCLDGYMAGVIARLLNQHPEWMEGDG